MITTVRRELCSCDTDCVNGVTEYFPFGNTRVRDVFKDFDFGGNISEDNKVTKVLFLGCGDLRNTFQATTSKNSQNLEIHLNDSHSSVLARNIIILKVVSAYNFNPDHDEDVEFLWDLWYNMDWSDKTRKRFLSVLKELIDEILPENVSIPNNHHLKKFKKLWSDWYSVSSKNKTDSESLLKTVCGQRNQCMLDFWEVLHPGHIKNQAKQENTDLFTAAVNQLADQFKNCEGIKGLTPCAKKKIYKEVLNCYREGSCRLQQNVKPVCVNPTLLDPKTHEWKIYPLNPFDGYLPMAKGELVTLGEGIMIQSCSEILKKLVSSYRNRIQTTKIVFHLEDAIELCSSDANKFDVIDCSNFVDRVGLANMIVACYQRLSNNPNAILYTEIMTDSQHSANGIVETSLCAPLSMIPTIFGLRLADHPELRDSAIDYLRCNSLQRARPVSLCWHKVSSCKNIKWAPSPVLNRCLTKMAKLCYLTVKEDLKLPSATTFSSAGNEFYYTPQTFSCILDSMIQRLGRDCWLTNIRQFEVAPQFNLARRTLEDWKKGKKITKFSSSIQSIQEFAGQKKSTALLRLAFVPKVPFSFNFDLTRADVHFIDNFQLELKHSSKEIKTGTVVFLLPLDHGFDETYAGFIVDVLNGIPVFLLDSIESMRVEEYNLPYMINQSKSHLLLNPIEKMHMKVESCIESEDQYAIKIAIECNGNVSGLKVTTNELAPCESCHDITVSLIQPSKVKPLSLSFPFPILAKSVQATLHRKSRHVDLVLKKSLLEPWPCEFHTKTSKWIIDNLVPWENSLSDMFNSVEHHVGSQFSALDEIDSGKLVDPKCSALQSFRLKLTAMMLDDVEYVSYGRNNDWYLLKLHRPLLTSPLGSPILLITALDDNYTKNMTKRMTPTNMPTAKEIIDYTLLYNKVFPFGPFGPKNKLDLDAETEEEFQLFRFLLRLNSTRIEPSKWQKKTIPLGGSSPWLATFFSPLYQDVANFLSPLHQNSQGMKNIDELDNENCCAACKKFTEKLKRCSRCRSTVYCSVKCQHSHWPMHKPNCKKV